jgi:para-nitrobenzyl esterase
MKPETLFDRVRPSRRMMLLGGGALAAFAACSPAQEAAADPTLVSTQYGKVQGVTVDGVHEFLGLRYAKPPLAALRFQAPQPLNPWSDEGDVIVTATSYGEAAVQMRAGAGAAAYPPVIQAAMTQAFAPPENISAEGNEDCLFLNVYTKATGAGAGATRPVMVWIHGGGFSYGQAANNIYRGHNLAKNHDVVFVGINHRLNIFGFLALDSAGIPGFEGSANAGMLDLVAALQWVRDNIAQFGGDPNNVTIFGQSGGGAKVSTLMAMPEAAGLFHKAVVQSGAGIRAAEKDAAAFTVTDFLTRIGIAASIAAEQLPTLTTADILTVAMEMGARGFRPSIDDKRLPRHPFDPGAPEQSANIPLMIGFTKDEQTLYNVGNPEWLNTTEAQVLAAAERQAPGSGQAIVDEFKALYPDYGAPHLLMQATGTVNSLRSSHTLASRKAAQAAPVYAYVFAHDIPPQDFILKSPHTAEIPYIMDNVAEAPLFAGDTEVDTGLGKLMSAVWVNFARTGNPNVEGLPEWPAFTPETRATLFFKAHPMVVENPYPVLWAALQANPNPTAPPL